MTKSIAIIPARGGSKRIPRKNIREFFGKPIIAWSIEAARASGLFDRIVVSTDDDEIATVAERHGAIAPFRRPAELADDRTGTTAVIAHAVDWLLNQGHEFENVCSIYPTAPLLRSSDLRDSLDMLLAGDWCFVFSACEFPAPIWRSFDLDDAGGARMHFPGHYHARSQDLPSAYHDAGQFYWGGKQAWLERLAILAGHSRPLLLPRWRVIDIDTEDDWQQAELMFHTAESRRE